MSTTMVHVRVNEKTKQRAAKALAGMGISLSDAVRMLLVRVAAEKALPFDVKVPNATREEVMCNAYTVAGTHVPVPVSVSDGDRWTTLELDLRSISAGVYLLRVSVGKTVYPLRITKL